MGPKPRKERRAKPLHIVLGEALDKQLCFMGAASVAVLGQDGVQLAVAAVAVAMRETHRCVCGQRSPGCCSMWSHPGMGLGFREDTAKYLGFWVISVFKMSECENVGLSNDNLHEISV